MAADPAWVMDAAGWLPAARRVESPHQDERPAGVAVDLLVIHCISLPPGRYGGDAVERLFAGTLDPEGHPFFGRLAGLQVSAHFLVARDGAITQFVACTRRAWHAGQSLWRGRSACNDFSIGVELEGTEFDAYTPAQYAALGRLQSAVCAAHPIAWTRGHSEIAPGRKTDPGPFFDWSRVRRGAPD